MLFITTYINAQNEITGFLGIKFEDKPYVAIDKLKQRYPNVEWKFPCIHWIMSHLLIQDLTI